MEHSVALASLSLREAAADALYRCVAGMDDKNPTMFKSAFINSKDTTFTVNDHTIEGFDAINGYVTHFIIPIPTTHHISNVRVDVKDGADTGHMTAHTLAYHYREEEAFSLESKPFVTGGIYFIDLAKDDSDGLWKIKAIKLKLIWTEGDRSIIRP
jgi:hypothetical protein